ncbi:MAG: peptidoglycan-binding protein [Clostridiales bacterium]|nr:peptidoglycan-binding protein [Clostridiales bacterium]
MDLLKTILVYMSMVFAASVQNAPDPAALPAYNQPTPTPYVQEATNTPAPTATPKPTPVPTIDITPNPEYKTIRVGDNGEDVRAMQEKLAQYGYYEGELDGRFGNQTRRAVEAFQYQHGLSVDGIAGERTLTVLYESGEVRMAPSKETPAPQETASLRAALTPTPPAEETVAPAGTFAPVETVAPTQATAPTESPAPTSSPTPTAAPTQTPVPEFLPMEGMSIRLEGASEALSLPAADGGEARALAPYAYGESLYLPLLEILKAAGINIISSSTVEADECAFVLGDAIYRLSYTEDQAGNPTGLKVFKNNQPQVMPGRDIRRVEDVIYLPAECVEGLLGVTAVVDEGQKAVIVTLPQAVE